MSYDRLKEAFFGAVRAAQPRLDFYAMYFGRVVAMDADAQTVDVVPDHPSMPPRGLQKVPLRGEAGLTVDLRGPDGGVAAGTSVLFGWENGDPSRIFACLWSLGAVPAKRVIRASEIVLGDENTAEPAAKGQTLQSYLEQLATLLAAHTHAGVTTGPGTSGPAPTLASIEPPSILASVVKVT